VAKVAKVVARDLVGTWRLLGWEAIRPDGAVSHPLGPEVEGLVIYGADGWMSAAMMSRGRAPLSAGRARAAPDAERAAAFDGFVAYSCRWRLVDGIIEHEAVVALNPSMVGTRQLRRASFEGRRLVVSTEDVVAGGVRRHRLVLQRVPPTTAAVRRPTAAAGARKPATGRKPATARKAGHSAGRRR
jgi:hypothetical protein